MKAEIYCRKCEDNNIKYLGDSLMECKDCGNIFDVYDAILDILKEE